MRQGLLIPIPILPIPLPCPPNTLEKIGDFFPEAYRFPSHHPTSGVRKGRKRKRAALLLSHFTSFQPPALPAMGEEKLSFGYEAAIFSWTWLSFLISRSDEEVLESAQGIIKASRKRRFNTAQLGAGWERINTISGLHPKELRLLNKLINIWLRTSHSMTEVESLCIRVVVYCVYKLLVLRVWLDFLCKSKTWNIKWGEKRHTRRQISRYR